MDSRTTRHEDGTVDIVQAGEAAQPQTADELELIYWQEVKRATFGLARFSRGAVRLLGVWPPLLRFGPAMNGARPIEGGLFAKKPHGAIRFSATEGRVVVAVEGFAPLLRGPFWRLEAWFHDLVGRRYLARAAGRSD